MKERHLRTKGWLKDLNSKQMEYLKVKTPSPKQLTLVKWTDKQHSDSKNTTWCTY